VLVIAGVVLFALARYGWLAVRLFPYTMDDSYRGVPIANAPSVALFTRSGSVHISESLITHTNIGLEQDTSAIISAKNCIPSFNTTPYQPFSPGSICLSRTDSILDNCPGSSLAGITFGEASETVMPPDSKRMRSKQA
jgi:hypothetical protein